MLRPGWTFQQIIGYKDAPQINPLIHIYQEFGGQTGPWWLTPVILAIGGAEMGRVVVQGQPEQTVHETTISKITKAKWTGGMAPSGRVPALQMRSPEFKPLSSNYQTRKKKVWELEVWLKW
jgi:hypothetical protein